MFAARPNDDRYAVYGVIISSDHDLAYLLPRAPVGSATNLLFEVVAEEPDLDLGSGRVVFDRHSIEIVRHELWDVVRFGGSATYHVGRDRIVCHLTHEEHAYLIPIQFLGMVMAVWLENAGRLVLHASAVATGEEAVVFMAGPKAGKTSLAASFARDGDVLVTEDLAALKRLDQRFVIETGYPMMRMWPETAQHFVGGAQDLRTYHPAFDKVWVPVERVGRFGAQAVPVRRIYLPQREDDGPVEIAPVASLDAVRAILSGSFLADLMEPARDVADRFDRVGELVNAVPVRTLRFPAGLDRLGEVRAAVLKDVAPR